MLEIVLLLKNKNQNSERPSDTRRGRRTRVYFTPGDSDELVLEMLGPGGGVTEVL